MSQVQSAQDRTVADAAKWFARLRAPDCTVAEREACERWLAADPAHAAAFVAAQATANRVSQALRADSRLQALLRQDEDDVRSEQPAVRRPGMRRWLRPPVSLAAAAACCVLTVALVAATSRWGGNLLQHTPVATYANNGTHARMLDLADGTHVYLDVGARVEVEFSARQRHVTLLEGRAYFDVAHDRAHPFSVDAAATRTTALGTRFEVDLRPAGLRVTLAEGSVVIAPTAAHADWHELLKPGEQLRIPASGERERLRLDADRLVAWSQGRLEFDGTPLHEALDVFNRYATVKVTLGDEAMADRTIGGSFVAGADSESFVRALSAVLPLHGVRTGGNEIVLFSGSRSDGG